MLCPQLLLTYFDVCNTFSFSKKFSELIPVGFKLPVIVSSELNLLLAMNLSVLRPLFAMAMPAMAARIFDTAIFAPSCSL